MSPPLATYTAQQQTLYATSMVLESILAVIAGITHDTGFSELRLYRRFQKDLQKDAVNMPYTFLLFFFLYEMSSRIVNDVQVKYGTDNGGYDTYNTRKVQTTDKATMP